jgi:hypothetical protein
MAIRYRCLDCLGEIFNAETCQMHVGADAVTHRDLADCPLHNYRMGGKTADAHSRTKAIRKKCLECMCEQPSEVKLCVTPECSLFEYRFGRYPTDEEILAVRDIAMYGQDKELWIPISKMIEK